MKAKELNAKTEIGGVRVARVQAYVAGGRPMVRVTLADESVRTFHATASVTGARPVRRDLAAGPVVNAWDRVQSPVRRYRASDGKWRGERDGTRREAFMSVLPAFAN